MSNNIIFFKNIKFYNLSPKRVLDKMIDEGGYLVAPAASSLQTISKNKSYHRALQDSTIAIFDSGFFCILLRIFNKIKVSKLSGFLLMKEFLSKTSIKKKKILLINPNINEEKINQLFFKKKKFLNINSYIAPQYNAPHLLHDHKLVKVVKNLKPDIILINIGGEKQEILARFINKKIQNKKISIFCLGAAIGFFTGTQAKVSVFTDKLYIGWLVRWVKQPFKFLPRVFNSFKLIRLFF